MTERPTIEVASAHELGVPSAEVRRFYRANWERRIALGEARFYQWQFVDAPESRPRDQVAIAVADGKMVGVMGLNERSFVLAGESRAGAELTTWVVSPDARGMGIGRSLINYLKSRYDVLLGMGISDQGIPVYRTGGFQFIKAIPRFFRIFDVDPARPFLRIERLGERLVAEWSGPQCTPVAPSEVTAAALADLRWPGDFAMFVRDEAHLRWRYDSHPIFSYRAFRGASGGREAGIIVRQDEIQGFRILHVIEVLGDPEVAVGLIEQVARDLGVAAADFYCTSSATTAPFRLGGWFSGQDDDCIKLFHLFYPPEFREPQTTSLVVWSRDHATDLLDTARLYVTKGDLDFDRPTLAYYEAHGLPAEMEG